MAGYRMDFTVKQRDILTVINALLKCVRACTAFALLSAVQ